MRVCFRVDATVEMGAGHLMRCLTLAQALRQRGAVCVFITRNVAHALGRLIVENDFAVSELTESSHMLPEPMPADPEGPLPPHDAWLKCSWQQDAEEVSQLIATIRPDWLVVDHYALDVRWEAAVKRQCGKILVIDDLADRVHQCDILLDQNFYADLERRYTGLVPPACRLLLGPGHVLLRPEFMSARRSLRRRDGTVRRVLVFFGGTDPTNQTSRVLVALDDLRHMDFAVDVVIGAANPHREEVERACERMVRTRLLCQVDHMAELIAQADLGIGAGGSAMWERCFLGLPCLTVTFADNQVKATQDVAQLGAIRYLGKVQDLADGDYRDALAVMLHRPDDLLSMSVTAQQLVQPGAQRLADLMVQSCA